MEPTTREPEIPDDLLALIQAARGGSAEALGRMLEACRKYLLLLATQELTVDLQPKGGASDLVQETFLEAQRDFPAFEGQTPDQLVVWLRQALLNNVANFRRRYRETEKRDVGREVSLQTEAAGVSLEDQLVADQSSPSGHVMREEREQALARALGRLPEHSRQIILLRHRDRFSWEEIGRLLGRTPGSAQKVWARAVEQLQQELEPPDEPA